MICTFCLRIRAKGELATPMIIFSLSLETNIADPKGSLESISTNLVPSTQSPINFVILTSPALMPSDANKDIPTFGLLDPINVGNIDWIGVGNLTKKKLTSDGTFSLKLWNSLMTAIGASWYPLSIMVYLLHWTKSIFISYERGCL